MENRGRRRPQEPRTNLFTDVPINVEFLHLSLGCQLRVRFFKNRFSKNILHTNSYSDYHNSWSEWNHMVHCTARYKTVPYEKQSDPNFIFAFK